MNFSFLRSATPSFLLSFIYLTGVAQSNVVLEKNIESAKGDVIAWRRQIHQHPELSNREFKTAALVAEELKKLGLQVKTGVGRTGVVGILKGDKPGPVIGLRADMDALPVFERVNLPFKSTDSAEYNGMKVPVMHACGHDAHVAILLGTAEVLSKMKKEIHGTVVFVFQPAEEGPPAGEEGGAPLMIKEGVMDNPKIQVMFGLHMASGLETGSIRYKSGAAQASADLFSIKIKGKQTHGSMPWLGVDPVIVSTQVIQGLENIVSRQEDLTKAPVVISVGRIQGGVRDNIIPEEVTFSGTIRTLDSKMRTDVHERIRKTAENIAESAGATAEVKIVTQTLVNYNDPALTKKMIPSLIKAAGAANVSEGTWITAAEDFSFFSALVPSLFFSLGGLPKGQDPKTAPPHHTPDFSIDDSQLDTGVKAFCYLVLDFGG